MAFLDKARRFAANGIPVPANGLTDQGRFALGRVVMPDASRSFSISDRFSFGRLVHPDGVIRFNDRLTFGGGFASKDEAQEVTERFDVIWFIDPTWEAEILPSSSDGNIASSIESFGFSFRGAGQEGTVARPMVRSMSRTMTRPVRRRT